MISTMGIGAGIIADGGISVGVGTGVGVGVGVGTAIGVGADASGFVGKIVCTIWLSLSWAGSLVKENIAKIPSIAKKKATNTIFITLLYHL
jgi:hypothetical protein